MSFYVIAQSENPALAAENPESHKHAPHLTLLPRFTVAPESFPLFVATVKNLLETVDPVSAIIGGEDSFYSTQFGKNVSVALVKKTSDLERVHTLLLAALGGAGGTVDIPEFAGTNWNPHMSDWGVNEPVPPMRYVVISQSTMVDEVFTTSIVTVIDLQG